MEDVTTMILAGGRGKRLAPLTLHRAKPAIRFGGIYRIIDFTLSNCLNSGLRRVFVLTQFASSSLERHLRLGWCRLFRAELGEFIEARPPQHYSGREWYRGTADSIYRNIDMIDKEDNSYLLILSGDHVYKMDYRKMLEYHMNREADLTIACVDMPLDIAKNLGVVTVDTNLHVLSFEEKPENPAPLPSEPDRAICNMGLYILKRDFLKEILSYEVINPEEHFDFGTDIIPRLLQAKANISAYIFEDENRKKEPYWRDIGTIDAYYKANMDLIDVDPVFNLYDYSWPIRSFNSELPPAKTVFNNEREGRVGRAVDSLLSPGVIISGGRVEKSVVSPEVRVGSFSDVYGCILFDRVRVGRGSILRNAIVDVGVQIPPNSRIGVDLEEDKKRFAISDEGIVVVHAGADVNED